MATRGAGGGPGSAGGTRRMTQSLGLNRYSAAAAFNASRPCHRARIRLKTNHHEEREQRSGQHEQQGQEPIWHVVTSDHARSELRHVGSVEAKLARRDRAVVGSATGLGLLLGPL